MSLPTPVNSSPPNSHLRIIQPVPRELLRPNHLEATCVRETKNASEVGNITFPAQEGVHVAVNRKAESRFWHVNAVEAEEKTTIITWFTPDAFNAETYLKGFATRGLVVNGLLLGTKLQHNQVFQVKWAFRHANEAVSAVRQGLAGFWVRPANSIDPPVGMVMDNIGVEPTYGDLLADAKFDVPWKRTNEQFKMPGRPPIHLEILSCPIWMADERDEEPSLKGYASPTGELADLFAVTITTLARRKNCPPNLPDRNRWDRCVHVCIDRDLAVRAWCAAIRTHGDQFFKPAGEIQRSMGSNAGLWPPQGRLDLYWEGKTRDYEALFICVTSLCFEPAGTPEDAKIMMRNVRAEVMAIDTKQELAVGYIGADPRENEQIRQVGKMFKRQNDAIANGKRFKIFDTPPKATIREQRRQTRANSGQHNNRKGRAGRRGKKENQQPRLQLEDSDSTLTTLGETPTEPDWSDEDEVANSTENDDAKTIIDGGSSSSSSDDDDDTPTKPKSKTTSSFSHTDSRNTQKNQTPTSSSDAYIPSSDLPPVSPLDEKDYILSSDGELEDNLERPRDTRARKLQGKSRKPDSSQSEEEVLTPKKVRARKLQQASKKPDASSLETRDSKAGRKLKTAEWDEQLEAAMGPQGKTTGADRRRQKARQNPEMESYARGI